MHFDVGANYYVIKHELKLQAAYQRSVCDSDCARDWADFRNASTSPARSGFARRMASMPIRSIDSITLSKVGVAEIATRTVNTERGQPVPTAPRLAT